mmetsp:Transcript_36919/g.79541  ORF Transcript_36919/g.79541 Transcript_36919/m.79541 type:complete len:80 (-) Transcript_36919:52-291(-)
MPSHVLRNLCLQQINLAQQKHQIIQKTRKMKTVSVLYALLPRRHMRLSRVAIAVFVRLAPKKFSLTRAAAQFAVQKLRM